MAKSNTQDTGVSQQRDEVRDSSLTGWVMDNVSRWENHRRTNFDTKWEEYYRLWRGFWKKEDKNRTSERSKLISPALSQAIESTVSELEEASFGQGKWFDVSDNFTDQDKTDIGMWRDQMNEDLEKENVPAQVSEVFFNGALYGTGIAKVILNEVTEKTIVADNIGTTFVSSPSVQSEETVRVGLKAIRPQEFVIDPSATGIDDALGMAHITIVPKHTVVKKQAEGVYKDVTLSGFSETVVGSSVKADQLSQLSIDDDVGSTMIIEYHGLVPRELLEEVEDNEINIFAEEEAFEFDDTDLIEAIVTIANGDTLLRAVANPYIMGDRCFMAYQHDTVPNSFWGRGIAEKGYNPQKALDAELRGRIDAMALSIHPMMAMDATRIQRGSDFQVAPGRNVFTNGDPKQILMPFNFGQVNPSTFSQTADLERQVQMGTGAMDSATPLAENRRNETSSGMSMIMGGAIKRSKRTLANIERNFLKPFINKASWRFMQFAPDRYPVTDITFNVHSTLGMVARELEQQQLANMMNTVPAESPAFWMLLKGIYEYSSLSNREEMLEVIEQMMQQSIQKQSQPEEADPLIALKQQEIQVDAELEKAKIAAKADKDNKDIQLAVAKLQLEQEKLALQREDMVLDAKIELAKMEQDSNVTIAQMGQKAQEIKNVPKPEKAASPAAAPAPVININGEKVSAKGQKKKITIKKTGDSLEGIVEDIT